MKFKTGILTFLIGMISFVGFGATDPVQNSKAILNTTTMLNIDWNIEFKTETQDKFALQLLSECEVIKSIDNLTDVATIVLPETVMNKPLNFEGKIKRGTEIFIDFGYNGNLKREYTGFIKEISVNDSSIKIHCEDALFLFRKGVKDKYFANTNLKLIAEYLTNEIDSSYSVISDYDITYEKFTIYQATAFDVLKKLKEETKANIFFDTENKVLHIHRPYTHKAGEVFYSMQKNIENSSLEFESVLDKKVEVIIESTDTKGNVKKFVTGTTGGDKINIKVGTLSQSAIEDLALTTYKEATTPKYKGTFDTWLIPYVSPGYSSHIKDEDYIDKKGWYYVSAVTTNISASGGVRTITPSKRLG